MSPAATQVKRGGAGGRGGGKGEGEAEELICVETKQVLQYLCSILVKILGVYLHNTQCTGFSLNIFDIWPSPT